jgi:hypothetical protein
MCRTNIILIWLLVAGALSAALAAEAPAAVDPIRAIATAESAELARLEASLAEADDPRTILSLQRCVTHVKLTSRLALHEAQFARTDDERLQGRLGTLIEDLRVEIERLEPALPEGYAFDPLPTLAEEVLPCAE